MQYNQSTRGRLADIRLGMRVDRTEDPLNQTKNIFTIVGGRIALIRLVGEFDGTVAPDGSATTLQIIAIALVGAQTPLSIASGSLAAAAIGTKLTLPAAVGSGLVISTGQSAAIMNAAPEYVVSPGNINLVVNTANAGTVKWSLWYVPVDDGAYVQAA